VRDIGKTDRDFKKSPQEMMIAHRENLELYLDRFTYNLFVQNQSKRFTDVDIPISKAFLPDIVENVVIQEMIQLVEAEDIDEIVPAIANKK